MRGDQRLCACGSGLRAARCCEMREDALPAPGSGGPLTPLVERALGLMQQNAIAEARQLCLGVLELAPGHPDALSGPSLTITPTGYVNAGTNGTLGAAIYSGGGVPHYLINQGRIRAVGTVVGVMVNAVGSAVSNASTGTITAAADAVSLQTGGPVTNSGTIVSTGAYGIRNSGIAFITNTGTGLISGYNGGVRSSSYLVASNSGTITATASTHTSVAIFFSSGSLDNSGLVSGGYAGVTVDNGTVTNTGTIKSADTHFSDAGFGDGGVRVVGNATITNTGTDGLISGYIDGIYAVGGSTVSVSNSGTIKSSANATPFGSYGIFSLGGLTLTNNGVITARKYVVDGHYDNNHVTNTGTISGGVAAVIIFGQGTVANNGGVMAGYEGVVFRDLGTVTNTGTISGTQNLSGVIFNGGGYLSNASSGIIQGVATGATVSGAAGTVVNAGTVTGHDRPGVW
jgi:hypothetical protein